MTAALEIEAKPLLQMVVRAFVDILPAEWRRARLSVVAVALPEGGHGDEHVIASEEGRRELVEPDDALYEATWKLGECFRLHGKPLSGMHVSVRWVEDEERWAYGVDFRYAE